MQKKTIILWALLAILVLGNAVAASFFYFRVKNKKIQEKNSEIIAQIENAEKEMKTIKEEKTDESKINGAEEREDEIELKNFEPQGERSVNADSSITVSWSYSLNNIENGDVFGDNRFDKIINEYGKKYKDNDGQMFGCSIGKVGAVTEGVYLGDSVYLLVCGEPGMLGFYGAQHITIKDNNDLVVLANYSDEKIDYLKKFSIIDSGTTIKLNNNIAERIGIPNSGISLIKGEESRTWGSLFSKPSIEPLFSYDGENFLYKGSNNCYYIDKGDGNKIQYDLPEDLFALDFINEDGEKNVELYDHTIIGGCGKRGCYNYSTTTKDQLIKIGVTSLGIEVFKPKEIEEVQNRYKHIYDKEYYSYNKPRMSYEEFLESNPLLYMQDPFGNFIELKNQKFVPAVECAKPVVYLYPEEETDIRVFVEPNGGLTVTEPSYDKNEGWYVKARPNGDLFNYADNTQYSYLFWEGHGFNYIRPEQGFVVEKDNVKNFLDEKLLKLGLIKEEADEFIEFWLPKMRENNYYFITFMPKEEFDKLAPFNIIPRPDTVIRVFMDFEGLDEKIDVVEQKIITPKRDGFTVVEWGGALH